MARIATGSIVADISGKVGNEIFSRNAFGPYVKEYVKPVQPSTDYQTIALGFFTDANSAWANLTDIEYTAWAAFTKNFIKSTFNGSQRKWSPKGLFIHGYVNRRFIGFFINPVPVMPGNSEFESLTINQPDSSNLFFRLNGGVNNEDYYVIYLSSVARNITVRSINTVQQAFFFSFSYLANLNLQLFVEWTDRFNPTLPTIEERLFGSVKIIHKLSGIQVGFGWYSNIGSGVTPSFTPASLGSKLLNWWDGGIVDDGTTPGEVDNWIDQKGNIDWLNNGFKATYDDIERLIIFSSIEDQYLTAHAQAAQFNRVTGEYWFVLDYIVNAELYRIFSLTNFILNNNYLTVIVNNNTISLNFKDGVTSQTWLGTTPLVAGKNIIRVIQDGIAVKVELNNVDITADNFPNSLAGQWEDITNPIDRVFMNAMIKPNLTNISNTRIHAFLRIGNVLTDDEGTDLYDYLDNKY